MVLRCAFTNLVNLLEANQPATNQVLPPAEEDVQSQLLLCDGHCSSQALQDMQLC